METSGNKYLHKKFKKQTSCSPVYSNAGSDDKNHDNSSAAGVVFTSRGDGEVLRPAPDEDGYFLLFKDNKPVGSVPNYKSTNCDASAVSEPLENSELRDANVKLDNQSSISNVAVSVNVAATCSSVASKEPPAEPPYAGRFAPTTMISTSTPSSCISKSTTTTTSLFLGNDPIRESNFNFDTKANLSDTTCANTVDKSSILDTVYSKSSLISSDRPNAAGFRPDHADDTATKIHKSDPDAIHISSESNSEKKICSESTGGKYVCTYCNLACSKPSVLQKHIRAHTNERPYPCVSCGFSFKTRSNLYKHCRSRTHANRVMGNKHVQTGGGQMDTSDVEGSMEKSDECLEESNIIEDKQIDKSSLQPFAEKSNLDIVQFNAAMDVTTLSTTEQKNVWEQKSKPYKPRFHTAKIFFEENKLKENDAKLDNVPNMSNHLNVRSPNKHEDLHVIKSNDLLKLRINELINKNNSIVNCDDAVVIRRRNIDNFVVNTNNNEYSPTQQIHWPQQSTELRTNVDEPLNLTAKNRKRCLSDSDNTQKSLIKELLLKNLSQDPNLQCKYCKMIFQTVTELEMHKLKYCNAKTSNIRYARSSSVNVASILTQNKNAFDNIPHMQHTTFPLKSPGPCLGKTRLIENDKPVEKYRTFSFDDNVILHHSQSDSPSFNKYMLHSPVGTFPLSPQVKKNPNKLFGGEVKITQTSGETRSFKIESESINKISEEPQNFMDFGGNLSENLVIKSTLQSGGTVLQNKSNYSPKMDSLPSPSIIRVYDNDLVSPNINLQPKFLYDKLPQTNVRQNDKLLTIANNDLISKRRFSPRDKMEQNYIEHQNRNMEMKSDAEKERELYKSNLFDFGQKAVKMLAPNLKPPNLAIPGLPIPSTPGEKILHSPIISLAPLEINTNLERDCFMDKQHLENLNFAKKQITLQQRMAEVPQPQQVYNPMNLFINGKVVRYVPGIPGPIVAETSNDLDFTNSTNRLPTNINKSKSPTFLDESRDIKLDKIENSHSMVLPTLNGTQLERKTPTIIVEQHVELKSSVIQQQSRILPANNERLINNNMLRNNPVSPIKLSPSSSLSTSPDKIPLKEESKKFVRPTSLALKPTSVAFKSHHGLTPTIFNQALISPDTPRVAKKYCQQYLNGNYFSYLGLKSSTKSVYCTLNKTQPFYVKHFKKLSMYSEWRQQESKIDSMSVSAYDSRQQQQKYTMAGRATADLIAHSSYKYIMPDTPNSKEENSCKNSVLGGYESNEDYTYIRGRGRGRYVCDQCGIRCKKPSMLKKHIRTHSDDRPYTCEHCKFSFKTKGNLTKHMKSKAHSKKYAATSTSTHNSVTTSSESEDSDAESSDESTRLQEHEAAHCLLSLAQKNNQPVSNINQESNSSTNSHFPSSSTSVSTFNLTEFFKNDKFLKNPDQINQVTNTNFAKNKILDECPMNFNAPKHLNEVFEVASSNSQDSTSNVSMYLGKSSTVRPLTYPYLQTQLDTDNNKADSRLKSNDDATEYIPKVGESYQESVVSPELHPQRQIIKSIDNKFSVISSGQDLKNKRLDDPKPVISANVSVVRQNDFSSQNVEGNLPANIVFRKRKISTTTSSNVQYKVQRNEIRDLNIPKAVDLSVPMIQQDASILDLSPAAINGDAISFNNAFMFRLREDNIDNLNNKTAKPTIIINNENSRISPRSIEINNIVISNPQVMYEQQREPLIVYSQPRHNSFSESNSSETFSQNSDTTDRLISNKLADPPENSFTLDKPSIFEICQSKTPDYDEHDQSAMQTLAEIAIKQVKLEKNVLAKSVASEYLKLALNNEGSNADDNMKKFVANKEQANDLMVKPEENKNCAICSKNFSKPSQLRLHMNIHYLERPFRCESCSVSFRTKGHLQKHERSASHHNKLSSSPALSSSEPRPFKCSDCNIAFRIHGHLAKHLRSKMHIMKLECLAKIPFGLYAELERANSLLTEINTTDGDLCLESLKILARKLFSNDPNKLDQLGNTPNNRDS